ncbi:MAG: helix-turn-helix domain-containing protein [Muribaculaceae bacterium]|nr:helix-turn-helix domain-containing protein [Muribaculaceae bacterium]
MDKNEFLAKYGLNLKIERIRNRMTQEELAEKVDCTAVHIGYIERGLKCPTIFQFLKIARALNIDLNEFFKEF